MIAVRPKLVQVGGPFDRTSMRSYARTPMIQASYPKPAYPRSWHLLSAALAVLCVCGCEVTGPRGVAYTTHAWSQDGLTGRRFSTPHFEIISTLDDAEFEAALPAFLEAAYRRYERTVPVPQRPGGASGADKKLTTYIFGARRQWQRFVQRRYVARYDLYRKIRSGGFTEGAISVSFYTDRSSTLATLAHEGWHQYVGARIDHPPPPWLNEGLACYHEAVEFIGDRPRFTPRRNTFRINSLREALHRDELLTLREIVDVDAGRVISQDHSRITKTYYAQAWALITFLRHGAGGRYASRFKQLLADIGTGDYRARAGAYGLGRREAEADGAHANLTLGRATFEAYFACTPESLADAYYDYLVRLAGF